MIRCIFVGLVAWGLATAPLKAQPSSLTEPVDLLSESYTLLPATNDVARVQVRRTQRFFSQRVAYSETASAVSGSGFLIEEGMIFEPDGGRLVLAKWSRVDPPFEVGVTKSGRAMGELFCGRGREGRRTRRVCFRDENGDGRFDAVASADRFSGSPARAETLAFIPIEPQPYRRAVAADDPVGPPDQRLSLMATTAGDGQLRILLWLDVEPVVSGYRPGIRQSLVVRRQEVPAQIELLGAKLTVHGFDDRLADISSEKGFHAGEMSFRQNAMEDLRQGFEIVIADPEAGDACRSR